MATASNISKEDVEKYLNKHPDFAQEWCVKNGQAKKSRRVSTSSAISKGSPICPGGFHSKSSTINMLVPIFIGKAARKISKIASIGSASSSVNQFKTIDKDRAEELRKQGDNELFVELIKDIANELEVDELCYKILYNVSILTNSDRGSLFLTRKDANGQPCLVSKFFDVQAESTLESSLVPEQKQITVPFGVGIVGNAAQTKQYINIPNAYEDPRFNKEVDIRTGFCTHSILAMPITDSENEVIGVAMIMNKKGADEKSHAFTEHDIEVFKNYATFCGIGLNNAQLFEMSELNYRTNQLLLYLAKEIFTEQTSVDKLIPKILIAAYESGLMKCERCLVYLLETLRDEEQRRGSRVPVFYQSTSSLDDLVFSKIYDMVTTTSCDDVQEVHIDIDDIKIRSGSNMSQHNVIDIAKTAAVMGETLCIHDLKSDEEIRQHVNLPEGYLVDSDGFETRNSLSIPMRNSDNAIVGIVQLNNKLGAEPFSTSDRDLFEVLAIFIGLGVHNANMYETAAKLAAKQAVALEVLSYHATAHKEETKSLAEAVIPSAEQYKLYSFDFSDFNLSDDDTLQATVRMFLDSGLVAKFKVPYTVLCRWICSVKKNYRPVTYHNWRHALNVAQMMFAMVYTGKFSNFLSQLEIFALLVGCLCHDLDHRGTNNAFQSKTEHPLAQLYSTSTMEHHHFDHCIMILNSDGNNILGSLPSADYRKCIQVLESAILATDLALYFEKRGAFKKLVDNGEKDFKSDRSRELLRSMMMTACDVSGTAKPWDVQKEVAMMVTSEFFEQGDLEKDKLHQQPIAMMDRERRDELPKMQVGFIEGICLPLYQLLTDVNPHISPVLNATEENKTHWNDMAETIDSMPDPEPEIVGQFPNCCATCDYLL